MYIKEQVIVALVTNVDSVVELLYRKVIRTWNMNCEFCVDRILMYVFWLLTFFLSLSMDYVFMQVINYFRFLEKVILVSLTVSCKKYGAYMPSVKHCFLQFCYNISQSHWCTSIIITDAYSATSCIIEIRHNSTSSLLIQFLKK